MSTKISHSTRNSDQSITTRKSMEDAENGAARTRIPTKGGKKTRDSHGI